jgi:ornithine cyclodeaminase/alanine dehydrogenase-like protein (mu-crystallin family)
MLPVDYPSATSTCPMFDAHATRAALPFSKLIPALREGLATKLEAPARHHHTIPRPDGTEAMLLLMPAWQQRGYLGVKIVAVFPGNADMSLPALHSTYLLSDGMTGRPLAFLDGDEITGRRTAAIAALAASFLAREEASSLLVMGSGRIASLLPSAFASIRPIRHVAVWSRNNANARSLACRLRDSGFDADAVDDAENAARGADIVVCATLSQEALLRGAWLRDGAHLSLIGSFTPTMREADDAALMRGPIFVDTLDAVREAGDLVQPSSGGGDQSGCSCWDVD